MNPLATSTATSTLEWTSQGAFASLGPTFFTALEPTPLPQPHWIGTSTDVAQLLARLAKSLESSLQEKSEENQPLGHASQALTAPEMVAAYLTRCLFSMFAEDVELLPKGAFLGLLIPSGLLCGALSKILAFAEQGADIGKEFSAFKALQVFLGSSYHVGQALFGFTCELHEV